MKKFLLWGLAIILALGIIGGMMDSETPQADPTDVVSSTTETPLDTSETQETVKEESQDPSTKDDTITEKDPTPYIPEAKAPTIDLSNIPAYSGKAYIAVNNNIPYFSEAEHTTTSFEKYSRLDSFGRCGVAFANIGVDIMPTEERGSIGSVKPSGWQTIKYENVDGKYLYNRCHLIGFQLSGENANEQNLITGTRYMNVNGMLPFENKQQ